MIEKKENAYVLKCDGCGVQSPMFQVITGDPEMVSIENWYHSGKESLCPACVIEKEDESERGNNEAAK